MPHFKQYIVGFVIYIDVICITTVAQKRGIGNRYV